GGVAAGSPGSGIAVVVPRQPEVLERLPQGRAHGPAPGAAGRGLLLVFEEQVDAGGFGQGVDAGGGVDAATEAAQYAAQLFGGATGGGGQGGEVQPVVARLVQGAVDGPLGGG